MDELRPDNLTQSRQGFLFTYAQIVFNQSRRYINLMEQPPQYDGWMKYTQSFQIEAERIECRILAILTTAFFLEAYIYDYGARRLSSNFINKYLDK